MQTITSISKYIFLAFLSCSFLVAWDGIHNNAAIDNVGVSAITNEPESAPEVAPPIAAKETTTKAVQAVAARQSNTTIWSNITSDFSIDHKAQSPRVQKEIHRLLSNKQHLNKILTDAGPYIYYIYQQTQARGLPAELALIPFIESEFNPNDHSYTGALGLWQLMPQTARELGVRVHSSYDGRRNIITSTKAALAYFNDLGKNFNGNWYLAIAAYNCGQGKVEWATRRMHSKDYWHLPLPQETKYYVPRLLAVAEIIKHHDKYGVKLPQISNQPYFKQVDANKSVSLTRFAMKSGVNIKTLQKLNPDLKHVGVVVAQKNGEHTVLVPVTKSVIV